ncbi:MAG: hypothetical protein DWQ35_20015 [Planctomycetota bacterium]|nr:MAG: hypothetical protein DWQ35_20015 [Planctomycetota bacterium]REK28390.1 MAG: hypothetical protein DWQ42_05285 [Planctomycetota bacterium]REK48406.1 MAG: hypothetical protein DWQ46_02435 [Planctomycetota bacterium]
MRSLFVPASAVKPDPVTWLWQNRIPRGALTIVEGDPGSNKSTLLYALAARVSVGQEMLDSEGSASPGTALLISDEDASMTMRRTLQANHADLDRVLIYDKRLAGESPLRLPSGTGLLESEIGRTKAQLVVLDPITSFIEGSVNVDQSVRSALGPLAAVAERTRSAIVLVRHLRKSGSGVALYRGTGSIALIAAARSSLLVGIDPGNSQNRIVAHIKSSLGALASSLSFRPALHEGGLRVEWLGTCSYSADEILSSASSEASALNEAAYILYSVLGNGPLWAHEVQRLVLGAGVSYRTLRRAKQLLLVKSKRVGFGKDSRFYWALPERSELVRHLRQRDLDEIADALFHQGPESPPETSGSDFLRFFEKLEDSADEDPADWWKRGKKNDEEVDDEEDA